MNASVRRTIEQLNPREYETRWVLHHSVHVTALHGGRYRVITPDVDQVLGLDAAVDLVISEAERLIDAGDADHTCDWYDHNHGLYTYKNQTGFLTLELAWKL